MIMSHDCASKYFLPSWQRAVVYQRSQINPIVQKRKHNELFLGKIFMLETKVTYPNISLFVSWLLQIIVYY